MNQEQFWSEFNKLPSAAQDLVADFVRFLQEKYRSESSEQTKYSDVRLKDEPFIGMWKDHHDLTDSVEFVRHLRTQEWGLRDE